MVVKQNKMNYLLKILVVVLLFTNTIVAQEITTAPTSTNILQQEKPLVNQSKKLALLLPFNITKLQNDTVNTIAELLVVKENLSIKVDAVQNSSAEIKAKETEIKSIAEGIDKLSLSIFNERKKAIKEVKTSFIYSFEKGVEMLKEVYEDENSSGAVKVNVKFWKVVDGKEINLNGEETINIILQLSIALFLLK